MSAQTEKLFVLLSYHSCLTLLQSATSGSRVTLTEKLLADQAAYKQKSTAEECGLTPPDPTAQVQSMSPAVPIQEDSLVSAALSALTSSDRCGSVMLSVSC